MGTPRPPADDAPEDDSDWLKDETAEHEGTGFVLVLDGDPGLPDDGKRTAPEDVT